MTRIGERFSELKRSGRKAFIAFITAGYPSLRLTERLALELALSGVDIIELGVPFSDPIADGPLIQEASQAALKNKTHLNDILRLVSRLRKDIETPIALMTYYNPVFCYGERAFARKAKQAGVDGIIIPDLPVEEGASFMRLAREHDLDTVLFISPTTSPKRLRLICRLSGGFIYYVSLTGVTGPRGSLPADLSGNIRKIKKYTPKPVCVGFGVSSPQQVLEICRFADGVIVGSAIIKKIKDNLGRPDLVKRVARFVNYLKECIKK